MIRRYELDGNSSLAATPDGDLISIRGLVARLKELKKAAEDEHQDSYSYGQSVAYAIILELLEEK